MMRQVTVYISENEYNNFIELARTLSYVKKIETDEDSTKADILSNIKEGFKEMHLINQGKSKTTSLSDFLDEL